MIRFACTEDRAELLALWRACFDDGANFQEWFFRERFLPSFCVLDEREGHIVGAMHGIPLHIMVRGKILPCVVIGGVATLPEYQGKGVMRGVFTKYMREMSKRGFALIAHRPQHLPTFFRFGHDPSSDAQFLTLTADAPRPHAGAYTACRADEATALLYPCYAAFAPRYNGMIARSYPDMAFKCADYASDGMRCVYVQDRKGNVDGYCIYENGADEAYGEETVALSEDAYTRLYAAMAQEAVGRTLTLKLPSDARFPAEGAARETKQWNVLGLVNAGMLLNAVIGGCIKDAAIEVTDDIVPQNAGVYNAYGDKITGTPQVRISAGRLAQWLTGYRSLSELAKAGDAEILDPLAAARLDLVLPKRTCWIVDEY